MKLLVLLLGNACARGDDALGYRVFELLAARTLPLEVTLYFGGNGGLDLLAPLSEGYDVMVVVDVFESGQVAGTITRRELTGFVPRTGDPASVHDLRFPVVWQCGHMLGYALPRKIVLYGVEPKSIVHQVAVSEEVLQCVPKVAELVIEECNHVLSN